MTARVWSEAWDPLLGAPSGDPERDMRHLLASQVGLSEGHDAWPAALEALRRPGEIVDVNGWRGLWRPELPLLNVVWGEVGQLALFGRARAC